MCRSQRHLGRSIKAHEGAYHYNVLSIPSPTPYCVTSATGFGLLLDVDGPISSPVTRTLSQPGIVDSLVTLANAGIPIAFNTGRSDEFLRHEVLAPMVAGGLTPEAFVWGIAEKGATWFRFPTSPAGTLNLQVDESIVVKKNVYDAARDLTHQHFADLVFFDETKRTMVSLEQLTSVSNHQFKARQNALNEAVATMVAEHGYTIEWHGVPVGAAGADVLHAISPDEPSGEALRVDSSIIAVDIEHPGTGKDVGAQRFVDELLEIGAPVPHRWYTMGDSRSDYTMATWLHENGFEVAHVDVRPADGVPPVPYPVLTHPSLINDDSGAHFLAQWAEMVG